MIHKLVKVRGADFCDSQLPVISPIGRGPKGEDKGDTEKYLKKNPGTVGETQNMIDVGINSGALLINANTHGNVQQSSNTGLALRTNANGRASSINIGQARTQAAADVVGFANYVNDVPYTMIISQSNIANFDTHSVTFVNDEPTQSMQVGMVLWVGDDINRSVYTDGTNPLRRYNDYFVSAVYAGIITEISGNIVKVNNWQLLPYEDNHTPSAGNYTPPISDIYVNPCTGVYGEYDIITIPDLETIPNGYKLYGRQTHIYDNRAEGMYSTGEMIALHGSDKFRAGLYLDSVDDADVLSFFMGHGDGDWLVAHQQEGTGGAWPFVNVGLSRYGLVKRAATYAWTDETVIEALENLYGMIRLETTTTVLENNIPLSKMVKNAEYMFQNASAKINIVNDTGASILYQLSNSASRGNLAADQKLVITRTGNGQIMMPVFFASTHNVNVLHIDVKTGINIVVE